jgi:wyosine [tRNA(Phe)-imidazoG37] synthetase (radical SAM superfamily)
LKDANMISFGPVPSRRLGRSVGINNIPPKICTYSCVYCQLGRTNLLDLERREYHPVAEILVDIEHRIEQARKKGEQIDYLTFVPDGEPTLDHNLGQEIHKLKTLGIPVAVISNGSLIWRKDLQAELAEADWVSLKLDAVEEDIWRSINRPHGSLELDRILEGLLSFSEAYGGTLATETMLVAGLNDSPDHLERLAGFLGQLDPDQAYLSIPIRPPAEDWVLAPDENVLTRAYQVLIRTVPDLECLFGYEGSAFTSTGSAREDLLSITSVHPLREDGMVEFLARAGADWKLVQLLLAEGQLVETPYDGHKFYLRKLSRFNS